MKRKAWKWIFGLSLAGLVLLVVSTFGLWILANVGAVLFRIVFILDEDMTVSGISFRAFMSNFVGSPLFYMYLVDVSALLASIVALVVTRKKNR